MRALFLCLFAFASGVRVSYIPVKPYIYTDGGEIKGLFADIIKGFASSQRPSLKIDFHRVKDGQYGRKLYAGFGKMPKWNGLVGDIVSRKAEIAVAPLTITKERLEDIDFSDPIDSSGIVMLMRRPKPGGNLKIKRISDLMTGNVSFGVLTGGSTLDFFETSLYESYAKMGKSMAITNVHNLPNNLEQAIEKVKSENYVHIGEKSMLDYVAGQDCDLIMVGDQINTIGYGFGFEKNSKYLPGFNRYLTEIKANGLFQRLKDGYFVNNCVEPSFCTCSYQDAWNETAKAYLFVEEKEENGKDPKFKKFGAFWFVLGLYVVIY